MIFVMRRNWLYECNDGVDWVFSSREVVLVDSLPFFEDFLT